MVRITNGLTRHKRHKRFMKRTKGFSLGRNNVYKQVRNAVKKQGQNAYIGRKQKKRIFRRLWIERLSASLRAKGMKYSVFVGQMTKKDVLLDRKMLSNLAIAYPTVFDVVCSEVAN